MAVSRVFGLKAWNPWWFHWNQGFWRSWRPKASDSAKIPWFQWIPPRCFKLLYPNNTWIPPFWSAEFNWIPYQKNKKYERVSYETTLLAIFAHILALNTTNFSTIGFKKIWAIRRIPKLGRYILVIYSYVPQSPSGVFGIEYHLQI